MVLPPITEDYYAILEVTYGADPVAIKESYFRLAKLRHPDKNIGDPGATATFQLVRPRLLCSHETTEKSILTVFVISIA